MRPAGPRIIDSRSSAKGGRAQYPSRCSRAGRQEHATHEPLISTAMLTDVPLTGLSFLTRSRRRGTTQQIGSGA